MTPRASSNFLKVLVGLAVILLAVSVLLLFTELIIALTVSTALLAIDLILISTRLEEKDENGSWKETFKKFWEHLLRDVAIGFIVAVMVTGIYEGHLKDLLNDEKTARTLASIMQHNVPDGVWRELNKNVVNNQCIRRKVKIVFRLQPEQKLAPCRALLGMSYSYSLYGLGQDSAMPSIEHDVDEHFKYGDYPRFESATIVEPLADGKSQTTTYDGARLDREGKRKIFLQKVSLQPSYDYEHDKYDDAKAVKVTTVRTEIVELPGAYPLGIPELTDGPIEVYFIVSGNISIEPKIDTQWAGHNFTHVGRRKFIDDSGQEGEGDLWTYEGILLPGQMFLMYFKEPTPPPNPTNPS